MLGGSCGYGMTMVMSVAPTPNLIGQFNILNVCVG